ncbi:MAG TPA: hypothetical protein VKA39_06965 [Beijerinckiaceae bacterium]|nr:hypothetical protein [Beijerinckiaceae bacterium]
MFDERLAKTPDGFVVHEVMREKADGFAPICATLGPVDHGAGKRRHEHRRVQQCAAATPVDGVEVRIDLHEAGRRKLRRPVLESRDAAVTKSRQRRHEVRGGTVPWWHENRDERQPGGSCRGEAFGSVLRQFAERPVWAELGLFLTGGSVVQVSVAVYQHGREALVGKSLGE